MIGKPFQFLSVVILLFSCVSANAQSNIEFGDDASTWANDDECDDPRFVGRGMATTLLEDDAYHDAADCRNLFERGRISLVDSADGIGSNFGRLEESDRTLDDGEYVDEYSFYAEAGQVATIDLRSSEFDTYLFVVAPNGDQDDNDDHEGDQDRSQLAMAIEETGAYKVYVTSYEAAEAGSYTLNIAVDSPPQVAMFEERGSLDSGDEALSTGEYFDSYEFAGGAGQRVRVDLRSNDFDTYLIVVPPDGEQQENDDGDSSSHSFVEFEMTRLGQYKVLVTSYQEGETGSYLLEIDQSTQSVETARLRESQPITVDSDVNGVLEDGDEELDAGEYSDEFEFYAEAGDAVRIEMSSAEFDTYLVVMTPAEEVFQNDDYEGSTARSAVEFIVPESGSYNIVATSYEARESGDYTLAVTSIDPGSIAIAASGTGRMFGLFAGISDYPGKENDLAYTADDARRLRDAMMSGAGLEEANQITLIDEDATRDAMRRAIADIAGQAEPEDTFVFFFSGHGDRVARADGPQVTDPDGLDETIELYDGAISDDELREMFADINAGTSLIFLDSCFSGGFAKDLISVPGRMGLFSSEEDVTSSVAAKFKAGGYLSLFLADAIKEKLADGDGDSAVSAIELSQYVYERYRADVKSGSREFVRTGGPQSGHQHLVVDRGSIGPYDILFR